MSGNINFYEAWEERTISVEKGNCIVHYYLRSCSGSSLLASVGTENSKGRMIYVVAKEFLEVYGSNPTVNAFTQWTKRRGVVKWLISFVRKDDPPPTNSDLHLVPKHKGNGSSIEKEEKFAQEDPIKRFPKKLRSSLVHQKQGSGTFATNLVQPKEAAASEPTHLKSNIGLSSIEPTSIQLLQQKPFQPASFQVGDNIEILCQDSGMRGCWFKCKIVKIVKKSFKVQYNDADDVEGSGKLEEWVAASRLANPDKLSLRHSGRLIIRPCPPEEPSSHFFGVGAAVEAWWNNGWWESLVITRVSLRNNDSYHVFLPGESKFLTLKQKDMRVAKDWINNTWVAVKPHPDVLVAIGLCLK